MDLSGGNGAEPVEVVRGFANLAHANLFARRRVRDSMEFCRAPGMNADQVRDAWFAFGEDAVVEGAEEGGAWSSASEIADFAARPCAEGEQRDWRAVDPRRGEDEDDGEGGDDPGAADDGEGA